MLNETNHIVTAHKYTRIYEMYVQVYCEELEVQYLCALYVSYITQTNNIHTQTLRILIIWVSFPLKDSHRPLPLEVKEVVRSALINPLSSFFQSEPSPHTSTITRI